MNTVIYIDNDNIKFNKYEKLLMKMFKDHNTIYKIFINESDLSNLDLRTKLKHNIFLCTSPSKYKNSTDISLLIECMDDLHSNNYKKFIIISNDTDFIPLCKRIHKSNNTCELCYDSNFHNYLDEIYDKTYDLSYYEKKRLEKLEKERLEKEKLEKIKLEKNKLEKERLEKDKYSQIIKYKLKLILDELIDLNTNITLDYILKILNKKSIKIIDFNGHKLKLKKFLIMFLPKNYKITKQNYVLPCYQLI
jgi:uncharacterized LabA/DUF88 family protein